MEEAKLIYQLKLHQIASFKADESLVTVLRVPGGWVYTVKAHVKVKLQDLDGDVEKQNHFFMTSTFVPLSGEFNS